MAESQDLEQRCVTAFKQGNHDQAVQLLPQLQQPGDVTTEFNLNTNQELPLKNKDVTPLHYASQGGHMNIIKYLITELGCDPTTANCSYGNLPLHIACHNGHLNATKYFINEQKCDPSSPGRHGLTRIYKTCVDQAKEKRHSHLVIILKPLLHDTANHFLVHIFSKRVLTDDSAAGKTLARVITERANHYFKLDNVEKEETSIVPSHQGTEYQFFTVRFLHVLLLSQAYSASSTNTTHLNRKCSDWNSKDGIRTTAELTDDDTHTVDDNETTEQDLVADQEPMLSDGAYIRAAMSDLEYDSDIMKAATQEILELKKQQQKDRKIASENNSSLQTKLEAAKQQNSLLIEELWTKQKDTEELQLQAFPQRTTKSVSIQASYLDIAPKHRGVEVCGETVLEVLSDRLPQKLVWSGYGFNIEVPAGALPPGVTASVAVRAILRGQFSLPENSELISAVYWISCSEDLLKPVTVNIQHCAVISSEEESAKFKFIIAKCSQLNLPYKFKLRDGVFNAHTQYATIQLKQFSFISAIANYCGVLKKYRALQFYQSISDSSVVANLRFVVLADLNSKIEQYKEKILKHDWKMDGDTQSLKFDYNFFGDIKVNLDLESSVDVDNWRISARSPLKILKSDVDSYMNEIDKPNGDSNVDADGNLAPCCHILLRFLKHGSRVTPLSHTVMILGTTENSFFTIVYPNIKRPAVNLPQPTMSELLNELKTVNDWKTLGIHLHLSVPILKSVEEDNATSNSRKIDMLNEWLKSNPEAAWEDVVSALRKMNEECVAKSIEKKHCGIEVGAAAAATMTRNVENDQTERKTSSRCGYLLVCLLILVIAIFVYGL